MGSSGTLLEREREREREREERAVDDCNRTKPQLSQ